MAGDVPGQVSADVLVVGGGPTGLYAAYYAAFRGLSVAVIDSLEQPGGQVTAMYPEKLIYDVAGFPAVRGRDLVAGLVAQADRFGPVYLLGHEARTLEFAGGGPRVTTSRGTRVDCGAVIVTGGIGPFAPRRLDGGAEYEGRGLAYFAPRLSDYAGKDVIVGGGGSAFDWAEEAQVRHQDGAVTTLRTQGVIAALGFLADLGPLESWGLRLDGRRIAADTIDGHEPAPRVRGGRHRRLSRQGPADLRRVRRGGDGREQRHDRPGPRRGPVPWSLHRRARLRLALRGADALRHHPGMRRRHGHVLRRPVSGGRTTTRRCTWARADGSSCAVGAFLAAFLAAFLEEFPGVRGVWSDASAAMLAQARERLADHEGRVDFRIVDMTDLAGGGVPAGADVIITSRADHHLDRAGLAAFYSEAAGLLAPAAG